ncbi:MAG: hypothetical protein HYZ15_10285 [Sphingobacteriales bacterium]|nr:hypothetical protein [Sphingobacteriales bacterium]
MNGRFILALYTCVYLPVSLQAQTLQQYPVASYAVTGTYSLQHGDLFSSAGNPAALVRLPGFTVGFLGLRPYLLNELSNYTAIAGIPVSSGNFGVHATFSGFPGYNESRLGLAYGRKLGNKADIGVQFSYNNIRIAGYGHASAIGSGVGMILHLTNQVHAGIQVKNPVGGKFGKDQLEKLSSEYVFGTGYEPSSRFYSSIEIHKTEDRPVNIQVAVQYKPVSSFLIRAGLGSFPAVFWAGAGFLFRRIRLDLFASHHSQLGITPGMQVLFYFKSNEK